MLNKFLLTMFIGFIYLSISGCLYRSDGVFKQIGDSDYKVRIHFMDMFAVADGMLTGVSGIVTLEDRITPKNNIHLVLKNKKQQSIVANTYTDTAGRFLMSGTLFDDSCIIEIDSSEYFGKTEITVKLNRNNWCEIIAYKKDGERTPH